MQWFVESDTILSKTKLGFFCLATFYFCSLSSQVNPSSWSPRKTPNEERIWAPNAVPKHMDGFAVFDPHVAIQLSRWDRSRHGNVIKHIPGFYQNNPYRPKNEIKNQVSWNSRQRHKFCFSHAPHLKRKSFSRLIGVKSGIKEVRGCSTMTKQHLAIATIISKANRAVILSLKGQTGMAEATRYSKTNLTDCWINIMLISIQSIFVWWGIPSSCASPENKSTKWYQSSLDQPWKWK